jgi:hypothetical protein
MGEEGGGGAVSGSNLHELRHSGETTICRPARSLGATE